METYISTARNTIEAMSRRFSLGVSLSSSAFSCSLRPPLFFAAPWSDAPYPRSPLPQ
jgi:hypothetical protein